MDAVRGADERPILRAGRGIVGGAGLLIFGTALPVAAVVVESVWRFCTATCFDPIPTPVHAAAILGLAAVNAALVAALRRGRDPHPVLAGPFWGAATAVAAWYSLVFLVVMPISVVGILFMGVGILGFAPMTAFWTAWTLRAKGPGRRRGAVLGALAAIVVLSLADLPASLAHVRFAAAANGATADDVAFLRRVVPRSAVHSAALDGPSVMSPVGLVARFGWTATKASAREIAWRATGSVPARRAGPWTFGDPDDVDRDAGSDDLDRRDERLCLDTSHMDGDVDRGAGVAEFAWTMVLRNEGSGRAEAIATVALPAGAVVSDATLWVNGEPRDAVFAERGRAQEAYENVVRRQRDPILVTLDSADRVRVRCFPVPARGTMQIRLRIAAPLTAAEGDAPTLALPRIARRNFGVCAGARADVSIAGAGECASLPEGFVATASSAGAPVVVGSGTAERLACEGGTIVFRGAAPAPVVVADVYDPARTLRTEWTAAAAGTPERLVVVVDASGATADVRHVTDELLAAVPDGVDVAVVAASDTPVDVTGGALPLDGAVRERVKRGLAALPWDGGTDSFPAFIAAGPYAVAPRSKTVWLRGPQPFALATNAGKGSPIASRIDLASIVLVPGRNVLASGRSPVVPSEEIESRGDPVAALRAWAAATFDSRPRRAVRVAVASVGTGSDADTTPLARAVAALWAMSETEREAFAGRRDDAVRIAASHRIVTQETAAIVLETDADYAAAGLVTPPGTVPTVPEPGEWAVIVVVGSVLVIAFVRRRRVPAA